VPNVPPGLLPNEGIADQLSYIISAPISGVLPWELMLWTNDLVPDADTVLDDLEEAIWYGYHRVSMDRSTWTVPTVNDGCAYSTLGTDPIVWTNGSSGSVTNYGVAYVDESSGVLRWVQRFDDDDIRALAPGEKFTLLPVYTLTSAECPMVFAKRGLRAAQRRKGKRR
jgi:hypothetical protein